MNFKKTLRKLISLFPEDDYREWYFRYDNMGGAYEPHFGILKRGGWHSVSGIDVKTRIKDGWYFDGWNDDPEHRMLEDKFGNILAAYVATACPANIEKLLEENDLYEQMLAEYGTTVRRLVKDNKKLIDACEETIKCLNDMTTDEFSVGGDRYVRVLLQETLNDIRNA